MIVKSNSISIESRKALKSIRKDWELYIPLIAVLIYYIIFQYVPIYGVQIAFKDFIPTKGIWGSQWVGFKHFIRFFNSSYFERTIMNTLGINIFSLVLGAPIPIILALALNEARNVHFKKVVQNLTYIPYFLSNIVIVGMLFSFLAEDNGIVNNLITFFGGESIAFMMEPKYFKAIYILSGIWQSSGWGSIIYLSALSSIDVSMYEAAFVDGASRWKQIIHITIPHIIPTFVILLLLNLGHMMNVGFDKIFLMQNNMNLSTSDVISTYVYRSGLINSQFSFASAVGLFNSIVNLVLVVTANKASKMLGQNSLW